MTKFNAIHFAAGLSYDMDEEIVEMHQMLDELIGMEEKDRDEKKIRQVIRQYSHLNSFLQGVKYMAEYIEDEDTKREVKGLVSDFWGRDLAGCWADALKVKWERELGLEIRVMSHYHEDGEEPTYDIRVGDDYMATAKRREAVIDYLNEIRERRAGA